MNRKILQNLVISAALACLPALAESVAETIPADPIPFTLRQNILHIQHDTGEASILIPHIQSLNIRGFSQSSPLVKLEIYLTSPRQQDATTIPNYTVTIQSIEEAQKIARYLSAKLNKLSQ